MVYTANVRLYLTADKTRVVLGHDPARGYLFKSPGATVSEDEVNVYGLGPDMVTAINPKPNPVEEDILVEAFTIENGDEVTAPSHQNVQTKRGRKAKA